jgi:hypothetical protein
MAKAVKKAATKKPAVAKTKSSTTSKSARSKSSAAKDNPIKYTDKSPGQPQLLPIFEQLKKLVGAYAKGHLKVSGDKPGQYGLMSDKTIEVAGRVKDDVYFAGVLVQKGYVGFYFMPVYAEPSLKNQLHPDLVKCLKGKSCFHIKKNDPELMQHVKDALKTGYDNYKAKGWI